MLTESITNDLLKETLYKTRLESGLDVWVWPKPGFNKKFVAYATRFGSITNRFVQPGSGADTQIPDGIAHFLEHKLFETKDGDVSDRFAQLGASTNASTSFTTTQYFFSCTDRFEESLVTLLDFVQEPYFTAEAVEKERGIINQEIRMYDDSADWQVFFRLLEAMYHHHPVRIDIAGTVETIKAIDVPILNNVYDTFYHPSNMVVLAGGDFDPHQVIATVEKNLGKRSYTDRPEVTRVMPEEPTGVYQRRVSKPMVVSRPKILLGYKGVVTPQTPNERLREEMVTNLILDILMGKASQFYSTLYEQGVIDESFSASFSSEEDHGYTMIGGDCDDPERLTSEITQCFEAAVKSGIDPAELERKKRKQVGRFLRNFNSPDTGCHVFLHYYMRNQDVFQLLDLLNGIEVSDLTNRLREHFVESQMAISTIVPGDNAKGDA